ncbi:hypothetical protein AVEN_167285-1 [Araneus ventricosus]|uniref:Peptidase A9 domain-containing protein n=1 Tax=Araneus ventricosus TaxID=182803 RepID=A0A4Y2HG29_ARAVE|nr:hypothetical protein AVEN_167285-1 [Araneus ventricosus]
MPETGPLTRTTDKQFEKLFAVMAEMKAGQAKLEQKMEDGQEEMRTWRRTRYGQEERKFLCFQPVYSIQSRAPYWPKKRTIIPARSECLIQGVPEVSEQFRYAVTDFPSQVSQKGVLVAAALVHLEREAIPVRVLNLNNKPKILDKGAVIATCEPVVDIVARPQEFSGEQHLPSSLDNLETFDEEQRTVVRKLLKVFQNLFSTCDADVVRCNMTEHRINTGDHPPIKQYPRRLPLAKGKKK